MPMGKSANAFKLATPVLLAIDELLTLEELLDFTELTTELLLELKIELDDLSLDEFDATEDADELAPTIP
jgi:hypothetical protein